MIQSAYSVHFTHSLCFFVYGVKAVLSDRDPGNVDINSLHHPIADPLSGFSQREVYQSNFSAFRTFEFYKATCRTHLIADQAAAVFASHFHPHWFFIRIQFKQLLSWLSLPRSVRSVPADQAAPSEMTTHFWKHPAGLPYHRSGCNCSLSIFYSILSFSHQVRI